MTGLGDAVDERAGFLRQLGHQLDDALRDVLEVHHERVELDVASTSDRARCATFADEERLGAVERRDLEARDALEDDAEVVLRELDDLQDPRGAADHVEVAGARILGARILLRQDADDRPLLRDRVLDEAHRLAAADVDRDDRAGEQHGVAQRKDGERVRDLHRLLSPCLGLGHDRNLATAIRERQADLPVMTGSFREACGRRSDSRVAGSESIHAVTGRTLTIDSDSEVVLPIGLTKWRCPKPDPNPTTAIDAVFEKLLADIVGGVYPAGSRLPAERELSRQLGASRPTLARGAAPARRVEPRRAAPRLGRRRAAVSRLVDRGDRGVPAVRQARGRASRRSAGSCIDMLAVRRAVVLEVIKLTASRIPKGGTARRARRDGARVVDARHAAATRARTSRSCAQIAEAARFTPGLWLLNRIAKLWLDAASELHFAVQPPDDYVAVHTQVLRPDRGRRRRRGVQARWATTSSVTTARSAKALEVLG